jgi:hypothetical protein
MCSSDFPNGDPPWQKKTASLAVGLDVKFLIDHNSHIHLTK